MKHPNESIFKVAFEGAKTAMMLDRDGNLDPRVKEKRECLLEILPLAKPLFFTEHPYKPGEIYEWKACEGKDAYVDLPFQTVWIENLYQGLARIEASSVLSERQPIHVLSALIHEIDPETYFTAMFIDTTPDEDHTEVAITCDAGPAAHISGFVNHWIELLNRSSTSMGSMKTRIKRKVDGETNFIKRVIIIGKRNKQYGPTNNPLEIDWSHSWDVRGHWRKVKAIGKDRSGEYGVKGFTWVSNYRKQKGKEYIKKTRIIYGQKTEENPK